MLNILAVAFLIPIIVVADNDPCDQFINTTATNEFTSPLYPRIYPNSVQCIKLIEAPPNTVIRLHFLENFNIEFEESCKHDFLEIRDGKFGYSGLIGGKICGGVPPSYIESSGNHLWLRFRSDVDIGYIGFKILIEYITHFSGLESSEILPCGGEILQQMNGDIKTEDEITTEFVNYRLSNSEYFVDCTWIIEAGPEEKIYLQFPKYELDKPNDCSFNFVEVYGSKTELEGDEGRLQQFCGSEPDSVTSKGNKLHLRFFSGINTEKKILKSNFEAYFSVFREINIPAGQQCHANTEFDCTDGTCIASQLRCSGIPDCKFRNDEDEKCQANKGSFQLTTDILIISFLGILLVAGMCSGLMLNIYRKLKQDKLELYEIREMHKSTTSIPHPLETIASTRKSNSTTPPSSVSKDTVINYAPPKPYPKREELQEMRDSSSQTMNKSADLVVFMGHA